MMNDDLISFLVGAGLLILYLIFSAMTEMGTKLPWKNPSRSNADASESDEQR